VCIELAVEYLNLALEIDLSEECPEARKSIEILRKYVRGAGGDAECPEKDPKRSNSSQPDVDMSTDEDLAENPPEIINQSEENPESEPKVKVTDEQKLKAWEKMTQAVSSNVLIENSTYFQKPFHNVSPDYSAL
jgi:hypothetical protein